ncbi:MAG: hypothetical protein KME32_15255 [Mojavia pulchra JT2-VF2]|uniref:Uncharacterized protein n=1 Tax=Mojavia pulchra JT2-VF2 TaxID=287848 RepID=A0A951Q0E0_9NOST|nr:hypothetical protein [Mojavia pulchra JT2-VF2]
MFSQSPVLNPGAASVGQGTRKGGVASPSGSTTVIGEFSPCPMPYSRISHHISQSLRLCRGAGEQGRVIV